MDYLALKNSLLSILSIPFNSITEFLQIKNDSLLTINSFTDSQIVQLKSQLITTTESTFKSCIQEIVSYIDNKLESQNEISIEQVQNAIQNQIPPSVFLYGKNIEYKKRYNCFLEYIISNFMLKSEGEIMTLKTDVCNLISYFGLPLRQGNISKSKKTLTIYLECCYVGNSNNGKGCGCKFRMDIYFKINEKAVIREYSGENGIHNHDLDVSKIYSDSIGINRSQIKELKETIKSIGGKREYKKKYPNTLMNSKYLNRLKISEPENEKEIKFIETLKFNQGPFRVIKNVFNQDNSVHSLLFLNIRICSEFFSKRIWFIDDSANTNIYHKKLLCIATKDTYGYRQIVCFGILFDNSSNSFNILLSQLRNIINYFPEVILTDRNQSQIKALRDIFPESHIHFCSIHILRSLSKYFNSKHPIIKSCIMMFQGRLPEELMFEVWNEYIGDTSALMDIETIEEDEEAYEFEEPEQSEIFYNTTHYSFYKEQDITNVNELKEEVKKLKSRVGIGCLLQLIRDKDHWTLKKSIEHGLYRNTSTNAIEGFFGNLKVKLGRKSIHLYELIETIEEMALDAMTKSYHIEIPDQFIDKNNSLYDQLTPLVKLILLEQIQIILSDKKINSNSNCMSCKIRNIAEQKAYPCIHLLLNLYGKNIYINYNHLSEICFKGNSIAIRDLDCSRNDLIKTENISVLNKIGYIKIFQNKNEIPRKNVEKRRKRVKKYLSQTFGFNSYKNMVNNNPYNNDSINNGYMTEVPVNISFIKSLSEQIENIKNLQSKMKSTLVNDIDPKSMIEDNQEMNNNQDEENNEDESSESESIDEYINDILSDYNINKECYKELLKFEETEEKIMIEPTVIQSLEYGILTEFRDYINKKMKRNKIYIPLKYNNFWNIFIVCNEIKYKKIQCKNCILNVTFSTKTVGIDIENKLKKYLSHELKTSYNDLIHIRITTHENYFLDDKLFVKTLRNIYYSFFNDEIALIRLIKSDL